MYARVQGEEDGQKGGQETIDQNCFNGTNNTNGSHGYLSVFFVFVLFPAEMWPTWKTPRKAEGYAYQDVVRGLLKWDSIFKAYLFHRLLIDTISMHGATPYPHFKIVLDI